MEQKEEAEEEEDERELECSCRIEVERLLKAMERHTMEGRIDKLPDLDLAECDRQRGLVNQQPALEQERKQVLDLNWRSCANSACE